MTMYSYSFLNKTRDLTPILQVLQEKSPSILSLFKIDGTAKTKHEWYDQTDAPIETTLSAAATAGTNTITVTSATGFSAGDTLTFDDTTYENATVQSVSGTTITLTANLSNNHSNGVTVRRISHPVEEGSTGNEVSYSQATLLYNYTQIFRRDVKVSRSILGNALEETRDNIIDAAVKQHVLQIWRELNNALIYEERRQPTGDGITERGKLGGLKHWLYNDSSAIKTDNSGNSLTETVLNTFLRSVREKGGNPDALVMSVATAQKIGTFNTASSNAQVIINQTTDIGGVQMPVTKFVGSIPGMKIKNIIIEDAMPSTMLFALSTDKLKMVPHENEGAIHDYDSTTPGFDGVQRTILGEYTMEIQNPYNAHGCLYNFTV